MARKPRFENRSEGDVYHIIARGSGRRLIFEDDVDRVQYLETLFALVDESEGGLLAWCLMDNHVHLLFHLELRKLSALMHRLHTKHGQFFNGRHGHVGHVFQGRYDCVPVQDDEQLLQTIRYIHFNPKDLDDCNWQTYPWSSYRCYLEGLSHCDSSFVLEIIGGPAEFKRFHEENVNMSMIRLDGYRKRLSDAEATDILSARLGSQFVDALATLPKGERDRELAIAHDMGASVRQLERITGIGRTIIARASLAQRY